MNPLARIRGRAAERIGKETQALALRVLANQGARCLQEIASPCKVIRGRKIYTAKVVGDISGVWPGGRAILCECKTRTNAGISRRPRPSDFELHQISALLDMDAAGGSALVAYLHGGQLLIEPATNFFPALSSLPNASDQGVRPENIQPEKIS